MKLSSEITFGKIIRKIVESFLDSLTRMIGIFNMAVKVIRLDFPFGAKVDLIFVFGLVWRWPKGDVSTAVLRW